MKKRQVYIGAKDTARNAGAWGVVIAMAILLASCSTGIANVKQSVSTNGVIPWVNTPVSKISNTSAVASSPPPKGKACNMSQLSVRSEPGGGAAQRAYQRFIFTNTSSKSCWLQGWPKVVFLGPQGEPLSAPRVVQSPVTGIAFSQPGAVVLDPGVPEGAPGAPSVKGQAVIMLGFSSGTSCATPVVAVRFILPGGSISSAPIKTTGGPNDSPQGILGPPPSGFPVPASGSCITGPGEGPNTASIGFFVSGAPPKPQGPFTIDLKFAFVNVPKTATPGSSLKYNLKLTNVSGRAISFTSSCPSYGEFVKFLTSSRFNPTPVYASYMLNCSAIGTLDNGSSVMLAMQLPIPSQSKLPAIPAGGIEGILDWYIQSPTLVAGGGGGPHPFMVTLK